MPVQRPLVAFHWVLSDLPSCETGTRSTQPGRTSNAQGASLERSSDQTATTLINLAISASFEDIGGMRAIPAHSTWFRAALHGYGSQKASTA
jgi:hypothetical protein